MQGGDDIWIEQRNTQKRETGVKILAVSEGRGLVFKWEEPMSTMKMKLSLQHNKNQKSVTTSPTISVINGCVPAHAFISVRRSRCSSDFCELLVLHAA